MNAFGGSGTGARSKGLVLTAMIFAVAMTFIDQTIVSIAAPTIQHDLGLSSGGMQWAINAYLLALAALFAFGGRLADIAGHRRMVVLGVIIFAGASALCGLTPHGGAAEAWLVGFRAVQGAGGAIMFPAAIAIVVVTFDLRSRGRALALFFGIAGALTAIGPIAGGYLIEWTWRAIFWINIPVALVALVLIAISKPANEARPAPMDYRGLVLIVGGVGLSVFGLQQSALWGWGKPAIWASITAGLVLLVVFAAVERRTESPLINVRIFENRTFLVENIILGVAMMAFSVAAPAAVARQALIVQLACLRVAAHRGWADAVLAKVAPAQRAAAATDIRATGDLVALTPPRTRLPPWRIVPAKSLAVLRGYYQAAQTATGVGWSYLAAINFVETDFGRVAGPSTAGAQGPMQFLPATWAIYGRGSIHRPKDAIPAAAHLLAAHGAAQNMAAALHAYNPSWRYVDAVLRYARSIRHDLHALAGYYHRQVICRLASGWVLLPVGYGINPSAQPITLHR